MRRHDFQKSRRCHRPGIITGRADRTRPQPQLPSVRVLDHFKANEWRRGYSRISTAERFFSIALNRCSFQIFPGENVPSSISSKIIVTFILYFHSYLHVCITMVSRCFRDSRIFFRSIVERSVLIVMPIVRKRKKESLKNCKETRRAVQTHCTTALYRTSPYWEILV